MNKFLQDGYLNMSYLSAEISIVMLVASLPSRVVSISVLDTAFHHKMSSKMGHCLET